MGRENLIDLLITARRIRCPAIIVDIKCRSPRDGQLITYGRLESYVESLINGAVDALATVTEPEHFGGSLDIARRIRGMSDVPLLRKEFFTSVDQMDESHDVGFNAVQLTMSTIKDLRLLRAMKARAEKLGMDVVLGVHSAAQLAQALDLGARVVGINNRDITALELDGGTVSHSEALMTMVPGDVLVISESALLSPVDVARAKEAGADAVLIGTAVAKSENPTAMLRILRAAVAA